MRLLVTRPAAEAAALADRLRANGHEVMVDPIITIRERPGATLDLEGVTGLLFTSGNGVRAFAAASERRDLPAYTVGDQTARAAREAGFETVESADGNVEALANLVRERRKPEDGKLLHVSGTVTAGDLAGALSTAGYNIDRATLYEAEPSAALADATRAAIAAGDLDGVLLFSPRTARHFAELIGQASLEAEAARMAIWCLSKPVADAAAPLRPQAVYIAPTPTEAALLELIGKKEIGVSATPVEPTVERDGAPARRRSTLPLLAAVTLVIVLAGGIWWANPTLRSMFAGGEDKSTSSDTQSPVPVAAPAADTLTPRLDHLENALDGLAPKSAVGAIDDKVSALAQRLTTLEAAPPAEGTSGPDLTPELQRLSADLAQLSRRVAVLESLARERTDAVRTERTLVLAAAEIRAALASSAPFDAPVALIRSETPDDKALAAPLAVLESHAKAGVASRTELAQQLSALPARFADPEPVAADAGLWDRISARVGGLVRVRRIDDGPGDAAKPAGADRLVADAEADLAAGDLAGAVKRIGTLPDRPAVAAKSWLAAAQARLDCEQAAMALEAEGVRRLSANQPATAP
ncbi:MAG TPA: uroporphyrinogen-III synthase [Aliidongia sp.]|nr:uroporphyrinogen-III synthase [Aliidongia sp.]